MQAALQRGGHGQLPSDGAGGCWWPPWPRDWHLGVLFPGYQHKGWGIQAVSGGYKPTPLLQGRGGLPSLYNQSAREIRTPRPQGLQQARRGKC